MSGWYLKTNLISISSFPCIATGRGRLDQLMGITCTNSHFIFRRWAHIDIAGPATIGERGSGFGVALLLMVLEGV